DILAAVTPDPVDDAAIPLRRAAWITVAAAPVLASRISYAGELGWELTTEAQWAVAVWDELRRAGTDHGLEPFGYRALDALRMEKGYRYFSVDMTMQDTPFEAGLGRMVSRTKNFVGAEALQAARDAGEPGRRLSTLLLDPSVDGIVYSGEAVRSNGTVIGRL